MHAGMIRGLGTMLATAALAASTMQLKRDGTPPEPGIPLTVAEDRAQRVSDLRYDLHFSIPATQSAVTGRVAITFLLKDATRPLALDFTPLKGVRSVRTGAGTIAPSTVTDHIVLAAETLREGRNEITLEFVAGDAALNRNPDFLYTLFVPARAHLTFPCFDQPDLKARWTLGLDVPAGWEAVANGAETARREADGRVHLTFAETEPLSTYLFAFAAGRFSIETAQRGARTFRMLHRETDAAKVARNRDAVFDLHASAIDWLERYTGIPYPWGKFDFLLVPSFQFGGMEHAGAIFYNSASVLLDPSATQNQKLGRASLIAHETAHMWFGDLVTMRWFNDVWMKEVFANFMAAKIVNPSFPEINHDLRFLLAHYPSAYDIDRTPGTNAIRQPLENLNEAGSLYGAIIYQKAPIVMRQLEGILGEAAFREGLQEYLRAHRFANASWPDLITLLDARTPEDLAAWSRAWVEEAGRPIVATELRVDNGRIATLAFRQRDPEARRGLVWNQRLQVTLGLADGLRTLPVTSRSRTSGGARGAGAAGSAFRPAIGWRCRLRRIRAGRGELELSRHAPARDRRSPDARRRVDRPLGGDAQPQDVRVEHRRFGARRAAPRDRRTERAADPRLHEAGVLDLPLRGRSRTCRGTSRAGIEDGAVDSVDVKPEVGLVLGASRRGAHRSDARVARTRVEKDRISAGADTGRTGLHHAGARAGGARATGVEGNPRRAADAHREPRSQGTICLCEAGALGRSGRDETASSTA